MATQKLCCVAHWRSRCSPLSTIATFPTGDIQNSSTVVPINAELKHYTTIQQCLVFASYVLKNNSEKLLSYRVYRTLNAAIVPDSHMYGFSSFLESKLIFLKVDLRHTCHQISMAEEEIQKTATATHICLFEFSGTSIYPHSFSYTFQRFIDRATYGLPSLFVCPCGKV